MKFRLLCALSKLVYLLVCKRDVVLDLDTQVYEEPRSMYLFG